MGGKLQRKLQGSMERNKEVKMLFAGKPTILYDLRSRLFHSTVGAAIDMHNTLAIFQSNTLNF